MKVVLTMFRNKEFIRFEVEREVVVALSIEDVFNRANKIFSSIGADWAEITLSLKGKTEKYVRDIVREDWMLVTEQD